MKQIPEPFKNREEWEDHIKKEMKRDFASQGGNARAAKLSPERRKEIAMMGVEAKRKKKEGLE